MNDLILPAVALGVACLAIGFGAGVLYMAAMLAHLSKRR